MTEQSRLRRTILLSSLASFAGIGVAVAQEPSIGALICLPAVAALAFAIHRYGRLGSD